MWRLVLPWLGAAGATSLEEALPRWDPAGRVYMTPLTETTAEYIVEYAGGRRANGGKLVRVKK